MKRLLFAALLIGCPTEEPTPVPGDELAEVVDQISAVTMKDDVDFLADDALGGRITGSVGLITARDYLVGRLGEIGLEPLGDDGSFVYEYPTESRTDRFEFDEDGLVVQNTADTGYDLVALLPGSDPVLAAEYIVVAAHYDHIGVEADGRVYNGALDDAAGTAALLEIARVLSEADAAPKRSVVFVLTDGEENGHTGMAAWLDAPTVPPGDILLGLSLDPMGRPLLPDVAMTVILGTERSPELDALCRASTDVIDMELVMIHREVVPVFSSDQDEFYESFEPERPGLWVVNPGMSWYHTVDDTADTIDYRVLLDTAKYMTHLIHRIGEYDGTFTYTPPADPGTQFGEDAKGMFDAVLSSDLLTGDERAAALGFADDFAQVAEAGTLDVLPPGRVAEALFFVLFDLTEAHPGPVPPPFPEQ